MDILVREDRWLDPERRGTGLDEAHRRLNRLLHHFAQFAGRLDLAFARDGDRLDRQQLAANLGPGETGYGADLVFLLAHAVAEFPDAEEVAEVVGGELDPFDLVLENLAQGLARDLGELALERPHAGLARVVLDYFAQRLVRIAEFFGLQAVRLHLLGNQMALGDLDLFLLGIAFEADDLHPVHQRLRHV